MDYLPSEAKQAARERFTGLWAAITTPFGAAGELDEAALRRDLDRLTGELRIDGVFCGGGVREFLAPSGAGRRGAGGGGVGGVPGGGPGAAPPRPPRPPP